VKCLDGSGQTDLRGNPFPTGYHSRGENRPVHGPVTLATKDANDLNDLSPHRRERLLPLGATEDPKVGGT